MQRAAAIGIVVLASALLASACDSASERSSEVAVAPSGPWRQAHVDVVYGPRFSKNGRSYPAHIVHDLFIDTAPPNRAQVVVLDETSDSVTPERFAELREMRYALRFAPDAHALALSSDGERTWTIFDLTVLTSPTEQPFWCAHRTFTSLAPWPSSAALAVEILGGAHPGASETVSNAELQGATRYACAHREDPVLREALVRAFLRVGQAASPESCVPEMARTDPALQQRLALAGQRPTTAAPP